jgi:hypothetical protein
MRNLYTLNKYRLTDRAVIDFYGSVGDDTVGVFVVPSPIDRGALTIVASAGEGWDHVSVSRATRCPNWPEMSHVAALFFEPNETAMQLHVPASDHVNNHPYCLHWWRPHDQEIPRPPAIFVGDASAGLLRDAKEAMALRRRMGL